MNTQLAEQQTEQALPLEQAIEQLIASYHADNEDVQETLNAANNLAEENSFLNLQIKTLTDRINDVTAQNEQLLEARKNDEAKEKDFNKKAELVRANAEKHMQQLSQALRQEQQHKNKLDDALEIIANWKKFESTPAKARKQREAYKKTIATLQAEKVQNKLTIKNYRHDLAVKNKIISTLERNRDELDYTKIYSKNGDNVTIYPTLCETNIGQGPEKQIPLWYMNDSGIGALYMLNEEGEAARAPTPRTGIKPKAETLEIMSTLLRKFKRNGNVVMSEDVKMLEVA